MNSNNSTPAEVRSDDDSAEQLPPTAPSTTPAPDTSHDGTATDESERPRRNLTISIRSLVVSLVIMGLVVAVGVLGWLYWGVRTVIAADTQRTENRHHAEQISQDYAVNAAVMDYQNLGGWKNQLVKDTVPDLREKLSHAADSMEQILVPLQWQSTAKPLAAKVRSDDNGIYVVDTFVSVFTKTTQAPDGLQSTATYSITVDSGNHWQITDVGGIG